MQTRCPHCRSAIDVAADQSLGKIDCTSCGSSFSLVNLETTCMHVGEACESIAHFTLLEPLGSGRFGMVWKCRDTQLDRIVALKVPRKDQLTAEEAGLFLREARAAAQLKHPSIVRIHEVGREAETPYLVSDYVEGANLSEWLTCRWPSFRESAEICLQIADALDHAHSMGIVHRDLKPSNIMVDLDRRPHIMDFGLAKREVGEITMTIEGKILGTPAYMSPEQARGHGHQADRRSDIYSLGVILYQLLTGELPFRGDTRMLVVQILSDDPPPPRKLNQRIPRDLETICLKCLEKDPERRYQSAREVTDDLGRWLNGEPIAARPVSRLERGARWCRRRPGVATLIALVIAVAVLGFAGVTWQWRRAEAQWRRANAARSEAEANFEKALQAVDRMLTQVGQETLANVPQAESIRRRLLEDALTFYHEFLQNNKDDGALRAGTGQAYLRLGTIQQILGKHADAERHFGDALELFTGLSASIDGNKRDECLADTYYRRGTLLVKSGRRQSAEQSFRRALALWEELSAEFPDVPRYRDMLAKTGHDLAKLLEQLGRHAEAEETLRKSLELEKNLVAEFADEADYRARLADSYRILGILQSETGRGTDAENSYRQAVELNEQLLSKYPEDVSFRSALSISQHSLATCLKDAGRFEGALALFVRAVELGEQLAADFRSVPEYRDRLSGSYNNLGNLFVKTDRLSDAVQCYERTLQIRQQLVGEFPDVLRYQTGVSGAYNNLGGLLAKAGRLEDAEECYLKSLETTRNLADDYEDVPQHRAQLANCHNNLGALLIQMGRADAAAQHFRESLEVREQLVADYPNVPEYRFQLAGVYNNDGRFLAASGGMSAAENSFRKAVRLAEELNSDVSGVARYEARLALSCHNLATFLVTCRDPSFHKPDEAVQLVQKASELAPNQAARFAVTLGIARYRLGDYQAAVKALAPAAPQPGDESDARRACFLAMACWQLGDKDRARQFLESAPDSFKDESAESEELRHIRTEAERLIQPADMHSETP